MTIRERNNAEQLLQRLADSMGISISEVRAKLKEMIQCAYSVADSEGLADLEEIPKEGKLPTPEEFVTYYLNQANRLMEEARRTCQGQGGLMSIN